MNTFDKEKEELIDAIHAFQEKHPALDYLAYDSLNHSVDCLKQSRLGKVEVRINCHIYSSIDMEVDSIFDTIPEVDPRDREKLQRALIDQVEAMLQNPDIEIDQIHLLDDEEEGTVLYDRY